MRFEAVIGLEVHVELATESKMFCSCATRFGAPPNTQCCPVCTGLPGALPVLNRRAVDFAVMAGLALHCKIRSHNRFDRKNYFYPDLPKAYQISQLYLPICYDGYVQTEVDGAEKRFRIKEIHMEEDAGKLTHDPLTNTSHADYNRCGVPLLEIVSEADFHNEREAVAFLESLRTTLLYLGISDCKMQEGSLRVDVNLSLRPMGQQEFGTRTEMKNLSSFRAVSRAIRHEAKRQETLLLAGEPVLQQTRRWDEKAEQSVLLRTKENADDYRYFPEPNLPPLHISEAHIAELRDALPELAEEKQARYTVQLGLTPADARQIARDPHLSAYFEQTSCLYPRPVAVSNWLRTELLRLLKEHGLSTEEIPLAPAAFASVMKAVEAKRINRHTASALLAECFCGECDIEDYIRLHAMEDNGSLLDETVSRVLSENPESLEQYRAGKTKVFAFFVGQTLRALGGKADPEAVRKALLHRLEEL